MSSEPEAGDEPAALHYPAAARNRDPLLGVLRRWLSPRARVLEIASGSGEHGVHFARAEPGWTWEPSDASPQAIASIEAHRRLAELPNLRSARALDVTRPWRVPNVDAIVCVNMLHVAPVEAALGLFAGAEASLVPQGRLLIYGPFSFCGQFTAESNRRFDESLRLRDPAFGVRDERDLVSWGRSRGLARVACEAMPANNHVLVFERFAAERQGSVEPEPEPGRAAGPFGDGERGREV